jgi:hypothetical protein
MPRASREFSLSAVRTFASFHVRLPRRSMIRKSRSCNPLMIASSNRPIAADATPGGEHRRPRTPQDPSRRTSSKASHGGPITRCDAKGGFERRQFGRMTPPSGSAAAGLGAEVASISECRFLLELQHLSTSLKDATGVISPTPPPAAHGAPSPCAWSRALRPRSDAAPGWRRNRPWSPSSSRRSPPPG